MLLREFVPLLEAYIRYFGGLENLVIKILSQV